MLLSSRKPPEDRRRRVSKTFRSRLKPRWRRRSELGEIRKPQRSFNAANLLFGILEPGFSEHFVLNVFELIGDFIELLV